MERIEGLMAEIQENIYKKALAYRESMITKVDTWEEFKRVLGTVKRLSAWLDEIVLDLSTPPAEVFVGHWIHTGDFITLQRATM